MTVVHITIELENTTDADMAAQGLRPQTSIRRAAVRALVDPGAVLLVLPEDLVDVLGLTRRGRCVATFTDDRKAEWDSAGPVTLRLGNRCGIFECLVAPASTEPLFGMIPLQRFDLLVDPSR